MRMLYLLVLIIFCTACEVTYDGVGHQESNHFLDESIPLMKESIQLMYTTLIDSEKQDERAALVESTRDIFIDQMSKITFYKKQITEKNWNAEDWDFWKRDISALSLKVSDLYKEKRFFEHTYRVAQGIDFESYLSLSADDVVNNYQSFCDELSLDLLIVERKILGALFKDKTIPLSYDKFSVLYMPVQAVTKVGEVFEADFALGAYSSQSKVDISVDGTPLNNVDGIARYKTKATSAGKKTMKVQIITKNPLTGEVDSYTKRFPYEVIE